MSQPSSTHHRSSGFGDTPHAHGTSHAPSHGASGHGSESHGRAKPGHGKQKRRLLILAGVAVILVLLVLIVDPFGLRTPQPELIPDAPTAPSDVNTGPPGAIRQPTPSNDGTPSTPPPPGTRRVNPNN